MDPLTRLISDRRGSAERFAVLVDHSSSPSDGDHARPDPLLDLAALAGRVVELGRAMDEDATPSPHFRTALRTRLLAVAAVSEAGSEAAARAADTTPWRSRRGGKRTLQVAAGSLACLVAVGGVAAAGDQSMPGDLFFGVKRTVEAVQLATSDSDLTRGQRHLQFAGNRLNEVWEMSVERAGTSRERERKVSSGLDEMDREIRAGTDQLTEAFRRSQGQGRTTEERAPLQALSRFSVSHGAAMQRLLGELPPVSRERAAASLALVAAVGAEADELLALGTCSPGCGSAAQGAGAPGGAAAGPCDCGRDGEPGAGDPAVGPPATGPGAIDPGAPGPVLPAPGVPDPAATPPGATDPGAPPADTAPGGQPPLGGTPGSRGGPLLPVPLPVVPALPTGPALPGPALPRPSLPGPALPGPALPGPSLPGPSLPGGSTPRGGAPTLAPSLPAELPSLAPPRAPLPGGVPLPR